MPAWWLYPAATKLAGAGIKYATRRKIKPFSQTPYGRHLKGVQSQGLLSASTRDRILGRVGAEAGNVAQAETTNIKGYLETLGMRRSIASRRLLSKPKLKQMEIVGKKRSELEIANERSKAAAAEKYALLESQTEEAISREKGAAKTALLSGIVDAVGTGAAGYFKSLELRERYGLDIEKMQNLEEYRKAQIKSKEDVLAQRKAEEETDIKQKEIDRKIKQEDIDLRLKENIRHNKEMERLSGERIEDAEARIRETKRHNEELEKISRERLKKTKAIEPQTFQESIEGFAKDIDKMVKLIDPDAKTIEDLNVDIEAGEISTDDPKYKLFMPQIRALQDSLDGAIRYRDAFEKIKTSFERAIEAYGEEAAIEQLEKLGLSYEEYKRMLSEFK